MGSVNVQLAMPCGPALYADKVLLLDMKMFKNCLRLCHAGFRQCILIEVNVGTDRVAKKITRHQNATTINRRSKFVYLLGKKTLRNLGSNAVEYHQSLFSCARDVTGMRG